MEVRTVGASYRELAAVRDRVSRSLRGADLHRIPNDVVYAPPSVEVKRNRVVIGVADRDRFLARMREAGERLHKRVVVKELSAPPPGGGSYTP